jgi:hypothetical protein
MYIQNIANLPAYILQRLKEWLCVHVCVCERERERGSERLPESNEKILSDFLFYSFPEQGSCHGMYWQMQIAMRKICRGDNKRHTLYVTKLRTCER